MGDTAEGDSGDRHQRLARRAVVDELLHAITDVDRPYTVVLGAPGTGVRTLIGKQLPLLLDGHAEVALFPAPSSLPAAPDNDGLPPRLVVGCTALTELPQWIRELPAAQRQIISVGPLSRSELHDFLEARLGGTVDTSTARILGNRSGHIPGVLTTMIRVLQREGMLTQLDNAWRLTGAIDPSHFRQELDNVLTPLPETCHGLFFTLCVRDAVSIRDLGPDAATRLAPLIRAGLVEQRTDHKYAVRAPIFAEAGELLAEPEVAMRLRRVALDQQPPPPRAVSQALRHHEPVTAAQVTRALTTATSGHDWDTALNLVTHALDHPVSAGTDTAAFRAELHLTAALALRFLDEPDEALAQLLTAEAVAREVPGPDGAAVVGRIVALRAEIVHYKFGELSEALQLLQQAECELEVAPVRGDLLAHRILHLIHGGEFREATALRETAARSLHQADPVLRTRVAIAHTLALCAQGRIKQALTGVRKLAVKSLLPRKRTTWVVEELSAAYFVAAFRSAGPAVLPRLMRQFESPEAAEYHPDDTTFQLAYSSWLLARGALAEAHRQIRACVAALEFHDPSGLAVAVAALAAETAALNGERHLAEEMIHSARILPPRSSAVIGGGCVSNVAAAELILGRTGAQTRLLRAAREFVAAGSFGFAAQVLHSGVRFGRKTSARELLAIAGELEGELCALHVAHARAVHDGDELALMTVADRYRDAGLVLHAAEAYALTVRLPGASEAIVRRARHSATQLLETIGPVHHALLGKLTTPPDTALTKREREVSELIALGLSNRDIAERLGLSVRTVEGHVARLYQKTGQSRRDPARRAVVGR